MYVCILGVLNRCMYVCLICVFERNQCMYMGVWNTIVYTVSSQPWWCRIYAAGVHPVDREQPTRHLQRRSYTYIACNLIYQRYIHSCRPSRIRSHLWASGVGARSSPGMTRLDSEDSSPQPPLLYPHTLNWQGIPDGRFLTKKLVFLIFPG